MDLIQFFMFIVVGLLAGFIDSIAGGGGLITVPLWSVVLGPGSLAIGTNKIVATIGSLISLLVYMRSGHVAFRRHSIFAAIVGLSSALGATLSPLVPSAAYRWFLIAICPLLLWVVYKKDIWIKHDIESTAPHTALESRLWISGFTCGLYDGFIGPGGGTLMFLALLLVARTPLLTAIATSKLANLASASLSLATYASSGHVLWKQGFTMAIGVAIGAFTGASMATKRAAPLARAALLVVASLLFLRLVLS